jgi:DnaA family protein
MTNADQLILPVQLSDQAVFESFFEPENSGLLMHLKSLAKVGNERLIWLWGVPGSGKTHLLQAACAEAGKHGRRAAYLPLKEDLQAGMLAGLEDFSLVCLDDVGQIAGRNDWESALFHLFNEVADAGGSLLIAADRPAARLDLELPDLKSRLNWGPVYKIEAIGNDDLPKAMALRARHRGLQLPEETSRFLLRRFPRDMQSVYRLLDTLDLASLKAQRRLTVPFVKDVLSQNAETG